MKIGIMGGTFDPLHIGHLVAADRALHEASLDEVWFVPAFNPPHKAQGPTVSAEHRLNMVRLAIADEPRFRLCEVELERANTSFSIDTAEQLHVEHPGNKWFWIIGADMVQYLPKWYRIDELVRKVSFIGLQRPGVESMRLTGEHKWLNEYVHECPMVSLDISSTNIRERISEGHTVRYLVPEGVWRYIKEHRLYESGAN